MASLRQQRGPTSYPLSLTAIATSVRGRRLLCINILGIEDVIANQILLWLGEGARPGESPTLIDVLVSLARAGVSGPFRPSYLERRLARETRGTATLGSMNTTSCLDDASRRVVPVSAMETIVHRCLEIMPDLTRSISAGGCGTYVARLLSGTVRYVHEPLRAAARSVRGRLRAGSIRIFQMTALFACPRGRLVLIESLKGSWPRADRQSVGGRTGRGGHSGRRGGRSTLLSHSAFAPGVALPPRLKAMVQWLNIDGDGQGESDMEDREVRAALDHHWAASDANDFEAEHQIYREDAVLEYPQSGERIRGRRKIQLSRTAQPNKKRFAVRRIIGGGDLWVTEFILTYDGQPSYTVSIMEFLDGKVARETQYFGDPFEPGPSRAQWVERMP
jgi:hypothetical protein